MNIVHNFGHVHNKIIFYRAGISNLQTRTSTFPDQEKLLERVNIRDLKPLKTKKLNTKNPKIKHCPCSKCDYLQTAFTDLIYNLQTRKKQLKK